VGGHSQLVPNAPGARVWQAHVAHIEQVSAGGGELEISPVPRASNGSRLSALGSGVSVRESGGSHMVTVKPRYSVAWATRLIDWVTVPPPHGARQASQCSNTRIVATHTRPWSNISARIGRLCARGVRGLTHGNGQTVTVSHERLASSIG
jgi:hypothetical protein